MTLAWLLSFSILGSVGSLALAGAFLLLPGRARIKLVPWLLSYATGTLLGAALLAVLPEALEGAHAARIFEMVLAGLVVFFLLEKFLLWHHCHHHECDAHHPRATAGRLILIGDSLHNFVDGVVLAAAFLTSVPLGITTAVAVIAHEVPQEVGDFALLLHSGYGRTRALLANTASALMTVAGALAGYAALPGLQGAMPFMLALAAASFLYVAMVDVIPELHHRVSLSEGLWQSSLILAGVGTIALLTIRHQ
jgi:zinc and cadmium transporter